MIRPLETHFASVSGQCLITSSAAPEVKTKLTANPNLMHDRLVALVLSFRPSEREVELCGLLSWSSGMVRNAVGAGTGALEEIGFGVVFQVYYLCLSTHGMWLLIGHRSMHLHAS
mmetsp:Transcript_15546/g.41214  ORF Transcript_15546/g.41214 Transcript_15546/m.41214 type:complete len:115 (-) Transcript_15546:48-392(-)